MSIDANYLEEVVKVFRAIHGLKLFKRRVTTSYHGADGRGDVDILDQAPEISAIAEVNFDLMAAGKKPRWRRSTSARR